MTAACAEVAIAVDLFASEFIYKSILLVHLKEGAMSKHVTDAEFDGAVLGSSEPVLVDFWAEWCGPCRMLSPVLDELSTELAGRVTIAKVNIDQNPEAPTKYNVRAIPTLILFKDGKPVATKSGALPKGQLKEWIESNVA